MARNGLRLSPGLTEAKLPNLRHGIFTPSWGIHYLQVIQQPHTDPRIRDVLAIRPHLAVAGFALFSGVFAATAQNPEPAAVHRGGGPRPLLASVPRMPISHMIEEVGELPALPEGVSELRFKDFYKSPAGPRGLEMTEALKKLDGAKVRLVGYFVFEDWASCSCPPDSSADAAPRKARRSLPAWMKHVVPGRIMMASRPVTVSLGHYGLCDDLPPQVAFLNIASKYGEPVFFRPGLFAITGTLTLGAKDEPDGRVSQVRIAVESEADVVPVGRIPAKTAEAPAAPVAAPTASAAPAAR